MRHRFECPLRWADQDLLGHVNNVAYVDYLQEARVAMLRDHGPSVDGGGDGGERGGGGEGEGVVVVRHELQYVAPLRFRTRTVTVETWVAEVRAASFTLGYEVFHDGEDGRTVYLRARTVLTPYVFGSGRPRRLTTLEREKLTALLEPEERRPRPAPVEPRHEELGHYPVHVRFSDVDAYGHVNNVTYAEYFQEARIRLLARLLRHTDREQVRSVVAQVDIDYRTQLTMRPEPYDAWSWLAHVGERSMAVHTEIRDGDVLVASARVVMVFVDPDTQRAVPPPDDVRAVLVGALAPSGPA